MDVLNPNLWIHNTDNFITFFLFLMNEIRGNLTSRAIFMWFNLFDVFFSYF